GLEVFPGGIRLQIFLRRERLEVLLRRERLQGFLRGEGWQNLLYRRHPSIEFFHHVEHVHRRHRQKTSMMSAPARSRILASSFGLASDTPPASPRLNRGRCYPSRTDQDLHASVPL